MGAVFQSNGAKFNVLVSLGSLAGTILIIFVLHRLVPHKNLASLTLGNKGMIALGVFLVILYGLTGAGIYPEKLPRTVLPSVVIFLWYLLAIALLWVDRSPPRNVLVQRNVFSVQDLRIFVILLLVLATVSSLVSSVSYAVLLIMFMSLMGAGVVLFSWSVLTLTKQKISLD
jgi:hypothetical protein